MTGRESSTIPILRRPVLIAAAVTMGFCIAMTGYDAVHAQDSERVFELRIEHGTLPEDKRSLRVTQGDNIRLRWSTDAPVVVHLHGYDIETRVVPGDVAEMRFKAHATGRFPANLHAGNSNQGGGAHHEAPLMYLEVYPR